jgi:hypothetical protein
MLACGAPLRHDQEMVEDALGWLVCSMAAYACFGHTITPCYESTGKCSNKYYNTEIGHNDEHRTFPLSLNSADWRSGYDKRSDFHCSEPAVTTTLLPLSRAKSTVRHSNLGTKPV